MSLRRELAGLAVAVLVAGCGAGSSSTSAPATHSPAPPTTTPPATASPTVAPLASIPVGANGGTLVFADQSLSITFPAGWVAIDRATAQDPAKVAAIKSYLGDNASTVDELTQQLDKNVDWWFTASTVGDNSIAYGAFYQFQEMPLWTSNQVGAIKASFGSVQQTSLTWPRAGVMLGYTTNGRAARIYGFGTQTGVAAFWFLSTTDTAPPGWSDIVGTLKAAGK